MGVFIFASLFFPKVETQTASSPHGLENEDRPLLFIGYPVTFQGFQLRWWVSCWASRITTYQHSLPALGWENAPALGAPARTKGPKDWSARICSILPVLMKQTETEPTIWGHQIGPQTHPKRKLSARQYFNTISSGELTYSPDKACLKMMFIFPKVGYVTFLESVSSQCYDFVSVVRVSVHRLKKNHQRYSCWWTQSG